MLLSFSEFVSSSAAIFFFFIVAFFFFGFGFFSSSFFSRRGRQFEEHSPAPPFSFGEKFGGDGSPKRRPFEKGKN